MQKHTQIHTNSHMTHTTHTGRNYTDKKHTHSTHTYPYMLMTKQEATEELHRHTQQDKREHTPAYTDLHIGHAHIHTHTRTHTHTHTHTHIYIYVCIHTIINIHTQDTLRIQ